MGSDRVLQSVVAGVAAGLVAAWVMNRFQSAIDAAGLGPRHDGVPSNVIAADRLGKMLTGAPLSRRKQAAAGATVHYAFGAVLGAVYAVASRRFPVTRTRFGTVYGTAVALTADEVAVPLLGLAPRRVSAGLHAYGLVSHWVFGAALEASLRTIAHAERRWRGR